MKVTGFIHIDDKYFKNIEHNEYVGKTDNFDLNYLIGLTKNTGEFINDEDLVKVNLLVVSPKNFVVSFPMDKKDLPDFWNSLTIKE